MADVSILGTGFMGAAIARTLIDGGVAVAVWNRTPAKAEPLRTAGATVANDAAEALALSPVTISVLADYTALQNQLEPIASMAGSDVVNLTTGQPDEVDDLEDLVTARGGRLLEGAIICYPSHIGTERGLVKFAGPFDVWSRHKALLGLLGAGTDYLGEPTRLANVLDAAQLGFYIPAIGAAMEAAAYGAREGVGFAVLRPVLVHGLDVLGEFLDKREQMVAQGDYSAEDSPADVYLAAARGVANAISGTGIDPRLVHAVVGHLERLHASGAGDGDFAGIYEMLQSGITEPRVSADAHAAGTRGPSPG